MTSEERLVGIEILNASKKIDISTTLLSYTLELDKNVLRPKLPDGKLHSTLI